MSGISLEKLIRLFNGAFPILPGSEKPEQALQQFDVEETGAIQVIKSPVELWSQGDILEPILFLDWSEEGEPVYWEAPGMIVTNTCDLDRKENIVFCPCFKLADLQELSAFKDIRENTVFDFFFLGKCLGGEEWTVDLSHPMTLPRQRVKERIEMGQVLRRHSLTQKGWYLFITKFAIKYLRPDDPSTMEQR
jgi:hypothetical protein